MKYDYYLRGNDFFQLQLYIYSKDKYVKKRYLYTAIIYFIFCAIISLIVFFFDKMFAGILLAAGTIGALTVPHYLKQYHFHNYRKVIKINFQEQFDKQNWLTFTDEGIILYDEIKGSRTFTYGEITEVIETGKYFYIHLETGHMPIPKEEVQNTDFKEQLDLIILKNNIRFISDLKWKW